MIRVTSFHHAINHYSHIHLGELETMSRGNQTFMVRMLQTCLKSIPEQMEIMQQALSADNREEVKLAAHRLRPAFHYLGRADISAQLEALEKAAYSDDRDVLLETITTLNTQAGHITNDARAALEGMSA
jgi:HPt (histidine-containing phosphotransfer) domain-containing protein